MDEKFDETVEEIINQIEVLGDRSSERVEHIESGSGLEEERAQEAYDEIRENTALESSANSFEGFEPTSSTPDKESENLTTGRISKVSSIIKSFETLQTSSETKPKEKSGKQTGIKRRYRTRTVTKEGDPSPLKIFEPKKRKVVTA